MACAGVPVSEHTWPRAPGVVYFEVSSVTHTELGFVLKTAFHSLGDDHLLVLIPEVTCGRGNVQGTLQAPYNGRRQTLATWRRTRSTHELGCLVPKGPGAVWLKVGRVWSNPSGDRKTPAKLLAENLLWPLSLP